VHFVDIDGVITMRGKFLAETTFRDSVAYRSVFGESPSAA
jgi:hypothetical protein